MNKNIQVILKKTTLQLGQEGDIIHVAPGYAFNYLIPNKMAELAGRGTLRHSQMLTKVQNEKVEIIKIKAKKVKEKLEQITKISIKKKTGEKQYIFGNINDKEIAEEIFKYTGITIDKKQIKMPEIKIAGIYSIHIQILDNIIINIKLQVLPINI